MALFHSFYFGPEPPQQPEARQGREGGDQEIIGPADIGDNISGGRRNKRPSKRCKGREQGVLRGAETLVADRHEQGQKGCRAHPTRKILEGHGKDQHTVVFTHPGKGHKRKYRNGLQYAENHQGTEQTET